MKKISIVLLGCFILAAYTGVAAAQPEKMKDKIMPEKNININQMIRIHYSGAVFLKR